MIVSETKNQSVKIYDILLLFFTIFPFASSQILGEKEKNLQGCVLLGKVIRATEELDFSRHCGLC